jgi:hypothetical protein
MPDDLRTPPDQPQQQPYAPAPPTGSYAVPTGPPGRIRPTGRTILLAVVTLGIYMFFYYFRTHAEIREHSGTGLGGPLALVIALVFNAASPFLLSYEVGDLYERAGRAKPVSGLTGLWAVPGFLILIGPFVWMIKTNGALNDYWRGRGAVG